MSLHTTQSLYTEHRFMPTLQSTIRRLVTTPRVWRSHLASAWRWGRCGAAVGVGMLAGAATTFKSTTTTTSTAPRTGMAALREANLWPTGKLQPGSKCLLDKAVLLPIGLPEPAALVPRVDR